MPTERSLDFELLDRFEQPEVLVDICQINFQKSCIDWHSLCQWIRSLSYQYLCISKVEHYRLFAHWEKKEAVYYPSVLIWLLMGFNYFYIITSNLYFFFVSSNHWEFFGKVFRCTYRYIYVYDISLSFLTIYCHLNWASYFLLEHLKENFINQ